MKSRSIGGVATDVCAAAAADVPAVVEVAAAGAGAAAEVADTRGANVDGVGAAEGAGLDVLAGALAAALVGALDGTTGTGSSWRCLPDVAAIDIGAAGGSSERSWRDSSGSGSMSSNAGAECVGATGIEATGVGAGGASRSIEVADAGSNGSKGGVDSSSNEESVNPGLVATRATKAAIAFVLPVVDKAAEAVEGVGAVVDVAGAEEVADPLGGPDVGDGGGVGELPGFTGRGGAFAAGGGEAAGAGRAGGTVGIAALGVGLGAVVVRADSAEAAETVPATVPVAGAERVGATDEAETEETAADAGRGASAARAVGTPWVPELAGRASAAPVDADPGGAEADAVVAPRVATEAEPVGAAPVLAESAGARGAGPAWVGCEDVGLGAADLLEVN